MDNKSVMRVKILEEAGWEHAAEAVRLNKKQYGKDMTKVMESLSRAGGGHDKFLAMISVWIDYTTCRGIHQEIDTYCVGTRKSSESTHHRLVEDVLSACIDSERILAEFKNIGLTLKDGKSFPINATAAVIAELRKNPGSSEKLNGYLEKFYDRASGFSELSIPDVAETLLNGFEINYEKYFEMFEGGEEAITRDTVDRMVELAMTLDEDKYGKLHKLKRMLPEGFLQRRIMSCNYAVLKNMIKQRLFDPFVHWRMFCYHIITQIKHPEYFKDILENAHTTLEEFKTGYINGTQYINLENIKN